MSNAFFLGPLEHLQKDSLGNAVASASISVYTDSTRTTLATLYTTPAGSATTTNPMTTNSLGRTSIVWVPPGRYFLKAVGTGSDATIGGQVIGAFSETDIEITVQLPMTIYVDAVKGNNSNPLPGPYLTLAGAVTAAPNGGVGCTFRVQGGASTNFQSSSANPTYTYTLSSVLNLPNASVWWFPPARGSGPSVQVHALVEGNFAGPLMTMGSHSELHGATLRNLHTSGYGTLTTQTTNSLQDHVNVIGGVYDSHSGTGDITATSTSMLNCVGITAADIGREIVGTGIPAAGSNTVITDFSGTTATLSAAATATTVGLAVTVSSINVLTNEGIRISGFGVDGAKVRQCYTSNCVKGIVVDVATASEGNPNTAVNYAHIDGCRSVNNQQWAVLVKSDQSLDTDLSSGGHAVAVTNLRYSVGFKAATRGANGLTCGGVGVFGVNSFYMGGDTYEESTSNPGRGGPAIVIDQAFNNTLGQGGYARNWVIEGDIYFHGSSKNPSYPASSGLYYDIDHSIRGEFGIQDIITSTANLSSVNPAVLFGSEAVAIGGKFGIPLKNNDVDGSGNLTNVQTLAALVSITAGATQCAVEFYDPAAT